jgi:D-3-phosphoglycerate dehydrogenase
MTTTRKARIAVAPTSSPAHGAICAAVVGAGGQLAAPADAEALVWLGKTGDDLRPSLHPGIRWVQLRAAGVETWLASGEIDDRRLFTSAAGIYAPNVAEHVLALMLAASRQLHVCARASTWNAKAGEGKVLHGATVGIVGAGGIGRAVIRLLEPFAVKIIAVTRSGRAVPGATRSLAAKDVAEIWPVADYVVLAAPATEQTSKLVDAPSLKAMPEDAWIVNVARGSLIDTPALVTALEEGRIGGAALDVTDPEPLPDGHPLWHLPNVIVTPHVANPIPSRLARLADHVAANVRRFIEGKEPLGKVDLAAGY